MFMFSVDNETPEDYIAAAREVYDIAICMPMLRRAMWRRPFKPCPALHTHVFSNNGPACSQQRSACIRKQRVFPAKLCVLCGSYIPFNAKCTLQRTLCT
jgi:hypothetical protein